MEIKKGFFTEIIFYNDENGYTIAEMETEEELITVVGNLPTAVKGSCYELQGDFIVHPRFGEQFKFSEAREVLPESRAGIESFLASGILKGVGPKFATSIVHHFGEEALKVIASEPERLLEVPGIGKKKAETISASFALHQEFAEVSLFFQGYGISTAQAMRLYKEYGKDAVKLIEQNPYRLVEELHGFSFRKADDIAAKMGIEKDSEYRIKSGIKFGLTYGATDGSTFLPEEKLLLDVAQILDLTREQVQEQLVLMAFRGEVQIESVGEERVVYLYSYYQAEQEVCKNLLRLKEGDLRALFADVDQCIAITERERNLELSEIQKKAVKDSVLSGVSVITGGPGTGKTTIINAIIDAFEESGFKVAIAAPTGRAAKRITESGGHPAQTIHRLLEYYYAEDLGDMRFGKTKEDPLDYDAVIIDEASMVDLMLMKGLTDALVPGTRLILVGDSNQLPSVGAGNVLHDLIESGFVQTSQLVDIYRQAEESMIVVNAHSINHGEYPKLNGKDTDFFFMSRHSEQDMQSLIVDLVTRRLPSYFSKVDSLEGIQVLSPTKKGTVGTLALNEVLQEAFNPPRKDLAEKSFGGRIFRTGDKVMQIRNDYQMEWRIPAADQSGMGVFNGDVGFIQSINTEYGTMTVLFDNEKYVQYDFSQLDNLELAYAITVHKSQGSEFPIVVMPISWFPPMLATRNLLYTAITRGKQAVVLVGEEGRLRAIIDNNRIKLRYSGLKYRLEELLSFE